MKLIVGLGNPGEKYRENRHNIGFHVADQVAKTNFADPWKARFDSLATEVQIAGEKALIVKPQGYMNRSGGPVRKALDFYKLSPSDVLVVCDDFSLPLGKLRIRASGSAGGQNGLKDVIAHLGTDQVSRLRVGIDEPPEYVDPADFVLSDFRPGERAVIGDAIIDAGRAVECWCSDGLQTAMNRFNGKKTEKE
jgi:PTH1 family peptidyl-tRNA hydrolase